MLRDVTSAEGTGRNAAFWHPVWGKTGTSAGGRDALFVGFTDRYVGLIWLGRQPAGSVAPGGAVSGGDLPARHFRGLMATLHEGGALVEPSCR